MARHSEMNVQTLQEQVFDSFRPARGGIRGGRSAPWVVLAWFAFAWCPAAHAGKFTPPEKLTDDRENYELNRLANGQMAFDSMGNLHVTYWSSRGFTAPGRPSFVYYRSRSPAGQWSEQVVVDDSFAGEDRLGGRHPSLAVAPDDSVWVVWHDHRNASALLSWIDNIEIYGDVKPPGGAFSTFDLRLTHTMAEHNGDNGYVPKIVADGSGRLSLAWYDFNANPTVSDIYLMTSDEQGVFDTAAGVATHRITDAGNRGNAPSFFLPDLAVDSSGTRHLIWVGGEGSGRDLYYAAAPPGASSVSEIVLAPGATDFNDPAHITLAPNDDVWIAYGDDASGGNENVVLMRRRAGEANFDPAITVTSDPARQNLPDHEIGPNGFVHLVWLDRRDGRHIYYGRFDPEAGALVEERRVTVRSDSWTHPTIALDSVGFAYVLFERSVGIATGEIWFSTNHRAAVETWRDYR